VVESVVRQADRIKGYSIRNNVFGRTVSSILSLIRGPHGGQTIAASLDASIDWAQQQA